jgi:hypothetical protein
MVGQESLIAETLAGPDIIVQSASDPDARFYYRLYRHPLVGEKYLCVVIIWRSDDCFLLTAHFVRRIRSGAVLWQKR